MQKSVTRVNNIGDWYTLDEAARIKRTGYQALWKHINKYDIPRIRLGGQVTMVKLSELESYIPRGA